MKSMQKGFTLIELMIVVAIIAILAAIAIPQYQTYVIKSQFTRVMGELGDQRVVVEDCLNNNETNVGTAAGDCVITSTSSDLMSPGTPTVVVAAAKSTITGTFGNHANPSLSGSIEWERNSSGAWDCGTSITNAAKYAPVNCQGAEL